MNKEFDSESESEEEEKRKEKKKEDKRYIFKKDVKRKFIHRLVQYSCLLIQLERLYLQHTSMDITP